MSYTNVFGGSTIYPSDVSYLPIALAADTPLEWPLENSGTEDPAARIIDVTPSASGNSIILPDATLTGAGQTILFNNLSPTYSFYVKDYAGNTLATVTSGTQWQVYLAATNTAAGTWRVFRYGASTASVQPSALAGFGLMVTGSTLSQSLPVTTFSTSGTTVSTSNRASALVWNGTGTGTLNLLTAASAGNNFFVFIRNEGGGDLTIEPAGSETINSGPNLTMRPGDSATVITDGATWFTIGLGQQAVFAFDYTSISVTGGDYTLAGSELNRIAYKFVGSLSSDVHIIVPPTVQQYWVNNATSGAFNLFIETSTGTPVQVNQGAKGIYYCDGTEIIFGSDPTSLTTPVVISDGGTGATTASGARLNLGITLFADAIVTATTAASVRSTIEAAASGVNSDITEITGLTTPLSADQGGTGLASYDVGDLLYASTTTDISALADVATGNALISGGVGAAPAYGKIGLDTHVSGTLPVASGGSGQTSYTDGQLLIGNSTGNTLDKATLTAGSGVSITNGSGSITIAATGSGGTVTSVDVSGGTTGLTTSGGPITGSGTITLAGTLAVANGGTGGTTSTGSGAVVLASSPTLVTPDLGTPSAGTLSSCTVDGTNSVGFKKVPQSGSDKTTSYALTTTDVGKFIGVGSGGSITIPDATFAAGDIISLFNNTSGNITITCSITTAYISGTNSDKATMTLATRGVATILFISGTVCVVSGNVT